MPSRAMIKIKTKHTTCIRQKAKKKQNMFIPALTARKHAAPAKAIRASMPLFIKAKALVPLFFEPLAIPPNIMALSHIPAAKPAASAPETANLRAKAATIMKGRETMPATDKNRVITFRRELM
jgi:hypothetical protein